MLWFLAGMAVGFLIALAFGFFAIVCR